MPRHVRHLRVVEGQVLGDPAAPARRQDAAHPASAAAEHPAADIMVVIAERHAPMRQLLRALIDAERDLVLIADTADLALAEAAVPRASSPVLVVDALVAAPLPGSVTELCARVSPAPVVVLMTEVLPSLAERVLRAGASGVILKERADAELADAVRTAADGRAYLSVALRAQPAGGAGFHGHDDGILRIFTSRYAG